MVGGSRDFTVEVRVGRVIEARILALRTPADADQYAHDLAYIVAHHVHARPVLWADHRRVVIYSQPVADRLSVLFGKMNERLERVAILAARTNATLMMQLGRIVREANNPSRRLFYDARAAADFLGEVLTPFEQRHVASLVAL